MRLRPLLRPFARAAALLFVAAVLLVGALSARAEAEARWTAARAVEWYRAQAWPVGCNFIPSTAINQLEMWQADTFDPATIDRELGLAESVGMNTARVFLHNIPWEHARLFETSLPVFKRHGVGAINWGLVKGRTNTIFAWSAPMPDQDEPPVWFRAAEVEFIRAITRNAASK